MSTPSLDGPLLRLKRAEEHLDALEDEVARFLATEPYVVIRHDEPGGRESYRAKVVAQPPARIATLAGDCIHSLRSSLDHLAWQLALLETEKPYLHTNIPGVRKEGGVGRQ